MRSFVRLCIAVAALSASSWAVSAAAVQFAVGAESVFVGTPEQLRSLFDDLGKTGVVAAERKNQWRVLVDDDDLDLLDPSQPGCLFCVQVSKNPKPVPIPCGRADSPTFLEKFALKDSGSLQGFEVSGSSEDFVTGFLGNDLSEEKPIVVVADLGTDASATDISRALKEICPACGQVEPLPQPLPIPKCPKR
jgi:hypothetical protein